MKKKIIFPNYLHFQFVKYVGISDSVVWLSVECSREKDCCQKWWLTFWQPEGKSSCGDVTKIPLKMALAMPKKVSMLLYFVQIWKLSCISLLHKFNTHSFSYYNKKYKKKQKKRHSRKNSLLCNIKRQLKSSLKHFLLW